MEPQQPLCSRLRVLWCLLPFQERWLFVVYLPFFPPWQYYMPQQVLLYMSVSLINLLASPRISLAESCLSCSQPRQPLSPSFQVDLKKNTYHGSDSNIAWVDRLKSVNTKGGTCTTQGIFFKKKYFCLVFQVIEERLFSVLCFRLSWLSRDVNIF